jgi:hypothetical protein
LRARAKSLQAVARELRGKAGCDQTKVMDQLIEDLDQCDKVISRAAGSTAP